MKTCKQLMALMTCGTLLFGTALADYEFDASVVCVRSKTVLTEIGGTVAEVNALAGQWIEAGEALATLKTNKVYASVDGDVTGIFCESGDSITAVTERYGALMAIEADSKYSMTASTEYSYSSSANKYIHVGEAVYLKSSDDTYSGTGFVTSVTGTDFTVEVETGNFYIGNTVYVYRSNDYTSKTRIGRGEMERAATVTVSGPAEGGSVVAVHVSEGDHVQKGDLLMETLSGEYDAHYCTGNVLSSGESGILASLNANVGAAVNKGEALATIYPRDALQLKVDVNEADLAALTVGTPVEISFNWNEDDDDVKPISGTVAKVLYTTAASEAETGMTEGTSTDTTASYAAYIDFTADENTRIGMTAIVRPMTGAKPEDDAESEVDTEPEVDAEPEEISEATERPERPEGAPRGEKP